VLSVLEGNEDKIYKDLENKLESQFLVDFLKSNLEGLGARSAIEMNAY
jgi:inositol 1,4,5-triphosphate receptor type 1/inositol 1,4,5-triphosphate receptor type 3